MDNLFAYQDGEKTLFFSDDYLGDNPNFYIWEKNSCFLLVENSYEQNIINMFPNKDEMYEFLNIYCSKKDYNPNFRKIINKPSFILEIEEYESNYNGYDDISDFNQLLDREEEITNHVELPTR